VAAYLGRAAAARRIETLFVELRPILGATRGV
jgi:hypothetical protein